MYVHALYDAKVACTETPVPFVNSGSALSHACFCYALMCSFPVSAYIVLVTSLRYHLFIWSVFSPKLLYEGMHILITAAICVFFTAMDQTNTQS